MRNQQGFLHAKRLTYTASPNLVYFTIYRVDYTIRSVSLTVFPYVIPSFILFFCFVEVEPDCIPRWHEM